jgi:hypothetical protein
LRSSRSWRTMRYNLVMGAPRSRPKFFGCFGHHFGKLIFGELVRGTLPQGECRADAISATEEMRRLTTLGCEPNWCNKDRCTYVRMYV